MFLCFDSSCLDVLIKLEASIVCSLHPFLSCRFDLDIMSLALPFLALRNEEMEQYSQTCVGAGDIVT